LLRECGDCLLLHRIRDLKIAPTNNKKRQPKLPFLVYCF